MEFNLSYVGLRTDIISEITGKNKVILDVGCATGVNGKYLLDKGIAKKVYGIEIDPAMALEAQKNYEKVLVASLDDESIFEQFGDVSFDVIIFGDILEHLDDPWKVLKIFAEALNPEGNIIISLPNAQHIDVFIHPFKKNTWPVNNRGIFDKTHRRFFTFLNIQNLVDQAKLKIVKVKRNFRFRDKLDSRFPFYGGLLKALFKKWYTFQYIIVCSHKN